MPGPGTERPRPVDRLLLRRARFSTTPTPPSCDRAAYGRWCRALLERGVYPPASQFEAWFPSLAHGAAQIEQTVEAAREAFKEVTWG